MAEPVIAPATGRDFIEYAGQLPPYRVKAWTAKLDGRVIGVGGLLLMPGGERYAFMDVSEEARRFPKLMHKTGLAFIREAVETGSGPIVATTMTDVPRAGEWLKRLGFVEHEVKGMKVYVHAGKDQAES